MRFKQIIFSLIMVLGLAGCSTTFVYGNIDWLVHWYIDDYVDLTSEQRRQFDDSLAEWLDWHRQQELPQYRAQLKQLRQQLQAQPLSRVQWLDHFKQARGHWERLRARLVTDLVPLARTLSDKQVESIFSELAQNDAQRLEERQERLEGLNQQQIFDKRVEAVSDDMKQWLGSLTDAQLTLIKDYQSRYQSSFELWMAYRDRWRQAAQRLLLTQRQQANFGEAFIQMMTQVEPYQGQQLQALRASNRVHYANLLSQLQPTLTDKQRRHLDRELAEWMGDISTMQED